MFIETRLFCENSHEKVKRTVLKRCKIVLEQMEKTDSTFLFEMVLMWFDLSTRDGFVSHVVATSSGVARTIRPSRRFERFKGCVVRAIRFFLVEYWLYLEDNSQTG